MFEAINKKLPIIIVSVVFIVLFGVFVWKSNINEGEFDWDSAKNLDLTKEEQEEYQSSVKELKRDEQNIAAIKNLAQLRDSGRDPEGAIVLYQEALKADSRNIEAWQEMGEVYYSIGYYLKAEEIYLIMTKIDSGYLESYRKLMHLYQTKLPDRYPSLLEVIFSGWESNSDEDEGFIALLANYYQWAGEKETAMKYYKELLNINPGDPVVLEAMKHLEQIKF